MLGHIQRRATELMKDLEHKSAEKQLWKLDLSSMEKNRLKKTTFLKNCLKGGCRQIGVSLFSQVTSDRTTGNGLKLHQGMFTFDIRKNFFTEEIVKHRSRMPREVVSSLSLKVLKKQLDVVLCAQVN